MTFSLQKRLWFQMLPYTDCTSAKDTCKGGYQSSIFSPYCLQSTLPTMSNYCCCDWNCWESAMHQKLTVHVLCCSLDSFVSYCKYGNHIWSSNSKLMLLIPKLLRSTNFHLTAKKIILAFVVNKQTREVFTLGAYEKARIAGPKKTVVVLHDMTEK